MKSDIGDQKYENVAGNGLLHRRTLLKASTLGIAGGSCYPLKQILVAFLARRKAFMVNHPGSQVCNANKLRVIPLGLKQVLPLVHCNH